MPGISSFALLEVPWLDVAHYLDAYFNLNRHSALAPPVQTTTQKQHTLTHNLFLLDHHTVTHKLSTMKIKKIRLNQYKRFHDLTIDLGDTPKRIIALVGPNGCGKSSVLDGILFRFQTYTRIGNKAPKGNEYHSINNSNPTNQNNITIDFETGDFDSVIGQKAKPQTAFSFRSPYRYNNFLKIEETSAVNEIWLNSYGASAASDIDDKMDQNYRRLYVKYNKYLNEQDCTPSQAKAKILGDLNASLERCLELKLESIGSVESSEGTLYFTKNDHPNRFDFNVLSSGEKEVVDILLDLYLRAEDYTETIFLLDEPELHINTSIQKKLLLEINRLVGPQCQIWIATHSIGFLRALQGELKDECQVIQFKGIENLASNAQLLQPMKKTLTNWGNIFETALDDLTGLVSPKQIIYCEGLDKPGAQGAERGFDAKALNNIFSQKYHDTLFVSSGGNTELDQRSGIALAIMTKVFSDVEILVFKDRDVSSGRLNTENDRQVYLQNNPQNHRIMKRWELENYLYDKEVLKAYCGVNSLTFNEILYDSFVTNIDDQSVKDETGRIKNACGITTSINPETFKINLSNYLVEGMNVYTELETCIFRRE